MWITPFASACPGGGTGISFRRGEPGPVITSEKQFRSREAAVEACINEIDNRLARTSLLRAKATKGTRRK